MKKAYFFGENKIEIKEVPVPTLKRDEARIRVREVGICGSDTVIFKAKEEDLKYKKTRFPVILGHEFWGNIDQINYSNDKIEPKFKVGDKVAVFPIFSCERCSDCLDGNPGLCRKRKMYGYEIDGAFSEYINVPLENVIKVQSLDREGLLTFGDPLAVALHALNRTLLDSESKVLIVGMGTIGFLILKLCKLRKIKDISVIISRNPTPPFEKLKIVERLGARIILSKKRGHKMVTKNNKVHNGYFDIVFECSGNVNAIKKILNQDILNRRSKIVFIGIPDSNIDLNLADLLMCESDILFSRAFNYKEFKTALDLIERRRLDLDELVSNIFDFEDIENAFKDAVLDKNSIKNIVRI